jgi:hypothetical protein
MLLTDKKAAEEADAQPKWHAQNRWNNTHREARIAHRAVAAALKAGTLRRGKCETCGSLRTEAHHDDYSKPLDVRWLCRGDHLRLHAQRRKDGLE